MPVTAKLPRNRHRLRSEKPRREAGGRGFDSRHLHSSSYSNSGTLNMSSKGGRYCSWQSRPSFTSRRSNTAALNCLRVRSLALL
jgi:hypothetical protein